MNNTTMQPAAFSTPSGAMSPALSAMSPHLASPFVMHAQSPFSVPLSTKRRRRKPRKRKDKERKGKKSDKDKSQQKRETTRRGPVFDPTHPHRLTSRQWGVYLMYCWGFFALGIFTSAPGPILPTLMEQTNCSLAVISFIFSARAIGFVLGSIISGYVMDAYQKFLIVKQEGDNATKFLLQKNQKIADYLWTLPKWNWWPMSSHNVFTISLILASITNAAIPYVYDIYSLSILVIINGICFGNINTFGNVLLLTLFDTEISHELDFDVIYGADEQSTADGGDADVDEVRADDNDEEEQLIEVEESVSSYGSLDRDMAGETTIVRMKKQEERVGPFMQFLQAIYALGGLLAPIFIQISFDIGNTYSYAFWLFALLYLPPAFVLLFYPEPIRMSVVSDRLKEIQKVKLRESMSGKSSGTRGGGADGDNDSDQELENDVVEVYKRKQKAFYSKMLCLGFAIFLLWYVGAQVGYGMYITTYAMDYLSTSGAIGRYLASANWFGLFVGRFVAVPLSHLMSAFNMVCLDLVGMVIGCFLLFFTLDWSYMVWISSIMVGFFMASVWPCMFVWAERLIPVTGVFASLMVGGGSLGEFIIPALQGNIMAAFGSQYFNHVMFAMSLFLLVNLVINRIIAKRLANFLDRK